MGSAKIQFNFSAQNPTDVSVDGLIIPVFKKSAGTESKSTKSAKPVASSADIIWPISLDKTLQADIEALANEEKFDGSRGKVLQVRKGNSTAFKAKRLILLGLGEADKVLPKHWETNVQKAIGALLGLKGFSQLALYTPSGLGKLSSETVVHLAVDAAFHATYRSMESKDPNPTLEKLLLVSEENLPVSLQQAESLASARSLVKDLVNHPANLKNTNTLVNQAKKIGSKNAKFGAVQVSVQANTSWIEKNMPCFYTVARGSVATDPPKFIELHYMPKSGKVKKHIAIVGKSVIFDTGGYQVKPGDYMVTMKGDMTGGAVALATMQAMAELQPKHISVSAYLAATPNKIDSDAMIPDSIVDTACGKKVEIRHTDAEGRLTLIDAVTKAAEKKPAEIITIATLTGAASVAVGNHIALMGSDEALRDRVAQAARLQGEPVQTLDVIEDDFENIKSKLDGADIRNTSQAKNRGAQTAAAFVMSGAPEGTPMAHMDIAGADMTPDEKATGVSVKTLIQYLLNEDAALDSAAGKTASTASQAASRVSAVKGTLKAKVKKVSAKAVAVVSPAVKGKKSVQNAVAKSPTAAPLNNKAAKPAATKASKAPKLVASEVTAVGKKAGVKTATGAKKAVAPKAKVAKPKTKK